MTTHNEILRAPPETVYAAELDKLAQDKSPRPQGWKLAPRAVRAVVEWFA